jgi:hypothetical protein
MSDMYEAVVYREKRKEVSAMIMAAFMFSMMNNVIVWEQDISLFIFAPLPQNKEAFERHFFVLSYIV